MVRPLCKNTDAGCLALSWWEPRRGGNPVVVGPARWMSFEGGQCMVGGERAAGIPLDSLLKQRDTECQRCRNHGVALLV